MTIFTLFSEFLICELRTMQLTTTRDLVVDVPLVNVYILLVSNKKGVYSFKKSNEKVLIKIFKRLAKLNGH